jgi:hypothetical protein
LENNSTKGTLHQQLSSFIFLGASRPVGRDLVAVYRKTNYSFWQVTGWLILKAPKFYIMDCLQIFLCKPC